MEHYRIFPKNTSQLMLETLGLSPSSSPECQDVVLVAIDFEHLNSIINWPLEDRNSQVGIAILDTRDLDAGSRKEKIKTVNFVVGSEEYHTRVAKRFLFGKSINISRNAMLEAIEYHIDRSRRIVLVGHGFGGDLQVLRHLGFDCHTSIVGMIDTFTIANELFPPFRGDVVENRYRLGGLMDRFNCPTAKLHCGGNDANFTLRLLLLLAVHVKRDDKEYASRLDLFRVIAFNPLPQKRVGREQKKKKVRRKKSPAAPEVQARIRAGRAHFREECALLLEILIN